MQGWFLKNGKILTFIASLGVYEDDFGYEIQVFA
jgi:hypothetical protein